jgi:hypothetical protein
MTDNQFSVAHTKAKCQALVLSMQTILKNENSNKKIAVMLRHYTGVQRGESDSTDSDGSRDRDRYMIVQFEGNRFLEYTMDLHRLPCNDTLVDMFLQYMVMKVETILPELSTDNGQIYTTIRQINEEMESKLVAAEKYFATCVDASAALAV